MRSRYLPKLGGALAIIGLAAVAAPPGEAATQVCTNEVRADVVAIDQPFFYNRLGAVNPAGMIYALRRDVVDSAGLSEAEGGNLAAGDVTLRADKRPRPLTLRVNAGDCLRIDFENLLAATPTADQPVTRTASIHVAGLQVVGSIDDDGSNVGANRSSLVGPGEKTRYTLFAEKEGTFMLYSTADNASGEGLGGTLAMGLFGAVNVEPAGAEWYRSQLTEEELAFATVGALPTGQPQIDYAAVYPVGHKSAGLPIMNMLNGNEIVHSDLNAVITGPNRGDFPAGTYVANPVNEPNASTPQAPGLDTRTREEPFREFTVIFHDEVKAVQAFPGFYNDPVFRHTLGSVKDGFAINYGTGGIGSEIIANRLGVGPMFECIGCKYEEFFLTSWAVGDPAMVVDIPANVGLESLAPGQVPPAGAVGPKASKALYPDDPSNVFHSYMGDRVKFRQLHVGPTEHHIFHLHAHQWLSNPDSDEALYLDSQAIGPGSGYTYEIAYNGSGNRNQTVGDSIFHCHFYPHFAQGMWAMWRVHDTFETGTQLGANGVPVPGSRAYPDAEITAGTPIPAMVPVPTLAMAPMPSPVQIVNGDIEIADVTTNPGYPFFIPGKAGQRPPHPPLDTEDDGGLPRHMLLSGEAHTVTTRLDFTKEVLVADAIEIPEAGTAVEQTAMAFHAARTHDTYTPEGTATQFITNGQVAKPGAPFADPCVDDFGNTLGTPRTYKGANIQLDITFNKAGWHYPQARILSLWGDVADFQAGSKAPEPFFFRANTDDCITFYHTNLVPKDYELDDFQVRTPTDIIGQHIHLVKFDVTSADGSGNGWNYEDGTFSPGEVLERIAAINAGGGLIPADGQVANRTTLTAQPHPYFGTLGAQTTIQRWFVDSVINRTGKDRTLRSVFTHDHYGPSTHQQAGLYASLVVEPKGSTWRDSETGTVFGTRFDGGPTSYRADILTTNAQDSYREFMFEFADYTLAYEKGGGVDAAGHAVPDPAKAISAPGMEEVGLPDLLAKAVDCPGGVPLPCPEAISSNDPGTFTVNYRNEPVALRVLDNNGTSPVQASGEAGNLAYAYRSDITRAMADLNSQPNFYPPLTADLNPGDPYTPLLRAYQGDKVQIRALVGAHEEGHTLTVNGVKWLQNPGDKTSGWRNAQMMGISEHFEFQMPILPSNPKGLSSDYLYRVNTSSDGQWQGMWGLLRTYRTPRNDLLELPNNDPRTNGISNSTDYKGICPTTASVRSYDVTAARAADILPEGTMVYNSRTGAYAGHPGPLHDPTALMYVNTSDLSPVDINDPGCYAGDGSFVPDLATCPVQLSNSAPREPLVLRANAGQCIEVTLRNRLPAVVPDLDGFNTLPLLVESFNANHVAPAGDVGLHPQMVAYDVTHADGMQVGMNPNGGNTAPPGGKVSYQWYAGDQSYDEATSVLTSTPVEFGAINLMPADTIKHGNKGLVAALIIEPEGSTWATDAGSHTQATVTKADGSSFREFVSIWQDDLNLRDANGVAIPNCCGPEGNEYEDAGQKGMNYRSEPLWFRLGYAPDMALELTRNIDFTDALSNSITAGADPETPVFTATAGSPVRLRLLQPGGTNRNGVLNLHGHLWPRQPYVDGQVASQTIGDNPLSQYYGTQEGMGVGNHFDVVINSAGGANAIVGDYLMRDQSPWQFQGGRWGVVRVTP